MIETLFRNLLREKLVLVTAESCTGGMLASRITDMAGSSALFDCGFVTYSNESKIDLLSVSPDTLAKHGAVSAEVAIEMAKGALARSRADVAISITGVAGPGGGSEDKPVGSVYFGFSNNDIEKSFHAVFEGDRSSIRAQACDYATQIVLDNIA